MKKYPFYLIFFALNYSFMKLLPIQDLILVPLVLIVLEGVFIAGFYYLVRDILRAGFLTFLVLGWVLYFGMGAHLASSFLHTEYNLKYLLLFLLPWTIAFGLLGSNWLWRRVKSPQLITTFLNTVMIAIVLVSGYQLVTSLIYSKTHIFFEPPKNNASHQQLVAEEMALPDVYYIILDAYGRQDTLQEYLNFDNSQFINFLESRGFEVADQSRANYDLTVYSIASSLNMNYIEIPDHPVNLLMYKEMVFNENHAQSFLEGLGYRFLTFYVPVIYTDITDSDLYFPREDLSEIRNQRLGELLLPGSLAAIPLEANILAPSGLYQDYQEYLLSSLHQITEIPRTGGPNFVFFHVLAPHNPYIFDQNGPVTPDRPYLLFMLDRSRTLQEQVELYRGQASFISLQVEAMIDALLKNSVIPPMSPLQKAEL